MEVILLADVRNLGDKDDVVSVKPGYANNFLIPQGYALPATRGNLKQLQENLRQASHRQEKIKSEAQKQADLINNLNIRIPALVGKDDKLFGSVTPLQVANILKDKGFEIDRRKIMLPDEIKTLGEYTATISLHKEVKAELKITVINKNDEG
jgi:large subunit ribosomal protein L9